MGVLQVSNRNEIECSERSHCQAKSCTKCKCVNFYKKTALTSSTPIITEFVTKLTPQKYCEEHPEAVEFDEGASDVPFGDLVPFIPLL